MEAAVPLFALVFHPRVRLRNWKIFLYILLTPIVLVTPLSYSMVLKNGHARSASAPRASPSTSPQTASFSSPTRTFRFSRLTIIGNVVLGAFSGFAVIHTARDFFPVLSRSAKMHPTDQEVWTTEAVLECVREEHARRAKDSNTLEHPRT
ncbi:hypothetical protein C8Q74DRAFT_1372800 [Fomes fomentarius]|nr:hypothetical protein C8Q74DRAFT_1372800 [Fomes fomentarius]